MDAKDAKTPKKVKKATSNKNSKVTKNDNGLKVSRLQRKQTEIGRVLELKNAILMQGKLSYLEYIELREELERLNSLKENFTKRAAKLALETK